MKTEAPRKQRAYKACDEDYDAAMKRAAEEKEKLATLIEQFVKKYGHKKNKGA
jgi:hypothetical protein